jgi:hypothetical protein
MNPPEFREATETNQATYPSSGESSKSFQISPNEKKKPSHRSIRVAEVPKRRIRFKFREYK